MKMKSIYVTVEPAESSPVWFSRVLEGLKSFCLQKRVTLDIISMDSGDLDTMEPIPGVVLVISSNIDWTSHVIQLLQKKISRPF